MRRLTGIVLGLPDHPFLFTIHPSASRPPAPPTLHDLRTQLQTAILGSSTTPLLLFRPNDPSLTIGDPRLGAAPVSTATPFEAYDGADAAQLNLARRWGMQERGWERVAPRTLAMVAGCTALMDPAWEGLDLDKVFGTEPSAPRRIRFLVYIDPDVWRIPANVPPAYQQLSGQAADDTKHPNGPVTSGDRMWEPANMPVGSLFPVPAPRPVPVPVPAVTPAPVVRKTPSPTYFAPAIPATAVPPPPPPASEPPHLSPHASVSSHGSSQGSATLAAPPPSVVGPPRTSTESSGWASMSGRSPSTGSGGTVAGGVPPGGAALMETAAAEKKQRRGLVGAKSVANLRTPARTGEEDAVLDLVLLTSGLVAGSRAKMRFTLGSGGLNADFLAYLKKEKAVVANLEKTQKEKRDAIKSFGVWGSMEHDDIKDISGKLIKLLNKQLDAETVLATTLGEYRQKLKEIKAREQAILDQQAKVKTVSGKLQDALRKQKQRESEQFKEELAVHTEELERMKAEHEGFKRRDFRDAFYLYFKAQAEYSQKLAAVSQFGRYLAEQIPQGSLAVGQSLPAFTSAAAQVTDQIMNDFENAYSGKPARTNSVKNSVVASPRISENASTNRNNESSGVSSAQAAVPRSSTPTPPFKLSIDQRMSALTLTGQGKAEATLMASPHPVGNTSDNEGKNQTDTSTEGSSSSVQVSSFLDKLGNDSGNPQDEYTTISRGSFNYDNYRSGGATGVRQSMLPPPHGGFIPHPSGGSGDGNYYPNPNGFQTAHGYNGFYPVNTAPTVYSTPAPNGPLQSPFSIPTNHPQGKDQVAPQAPPQVPPPTYYSDMPPGPSSNPLPNGPYPAPYSQQPLQNPNMYYGQQYGNYYQQPQQQGGH
ncbi:hypothetical protein HDU96_007214 [Phlyctochytrium bullatum]|nr:hypothetical protein HDU96_007214 [Phlyctochytrium bullatum]